NALLAIGKYKGNKDAAAFIAERAPFNRPDAEQAFIDLGPVSEPHLIALLKYPDNEVVSRALRALKFVGTPSSAAALKDVAAGNDAGLAMRARTTLAMVARRAANGGKDPVSPGYKPATIADNPGSDDPTDKL